MCSVINFVDHGGLHTKCAYILSDDKLLSFCTAKKNVALRGTPGTLGVPLLWCSCLYMAVLGNFGVGALWAQCIQSMSSYLLMLCR